MAVKVTRSLIEGAGFTVVPDRCTDDEVCIICQSPGCPDASGNRSVSLRNGMTNCWRCGSPASFEWYCKSLGIELESEVTTGADLNETANELEEMLRTATHQKVRPVYIQPVDLPRGFTRVEDEPDGYYAERTEQMAIRKHLTWDDMVKAGVGFTRDSMAWEPFAIFPSTEYEVVTYYQGRTRVDPKDGSSTKKFPSRTVIPFGSRYWIYNIDRLRALKARRAIVVESILNVLSLEKELACRGITDTVPICIFKHAISKEQALKLAALKHLTEVGLMFDGDALGSAWQAATAGRALSGKTLTVTEMQIGVDANDNAQLAVDLWEKRKKATAASALESLVRDL